MTSPRLSVVIASYRWPEALELSLASALAQTERAIEILVIEDGDDTASREVVAAADDERVRWLALDPPCGGQSGPNQLGIQNARAPIVAYLGHDDIWHRDHVATLLEVLGRGVDIAHATTVMLSEWEESEHVGLAGTEPWTLQTFVPPSSIAHAREGPRIVAWTPPAHDGRPIDYRFLADCHAAGATVGHTGQPTVVKFPAAWRRDSYVTRDVKPQRDLMRALDTDERTIERRLADVLASGVPGVWPAPPPYPPGVIADHTRRAKGLPALNRPTSRWSIDSVPPGPNWHEPEADLHGSFAWTHGDSRAWVRVDSPSSPRLGVRVAMSHVLSCEQLSGLVVDLDGDGVEMVRTDDRDDASVVFEGALDRPAAGGAVEVGIYAPGLRPAEVEVGSSDQRLLGVAVRDIEVY